MTGLGVTILEVAEVPLERALGTEMGGFYADIHREHGIDLRLGTGVERFEDGRRVERVVTSRRRLWTPCPMLMSENGEAGTPWSSSGPNTGGL